MINFLKNFLKNHCNTNLLINISFTDSRINLVNNTFNINKIGTLNLKENKFVEIEDIANLFADFEVTKSMNNEL